MSARNGREAKAARRRAREIRHVGGCSICGDKDVEWCSEVDAADPTYRAICKRHLAYAVATIFGYEGRGIVVKRRRVRPAPRPWEPDHPCSGRSLVGDSFALAIASAKDSTPPASPSTPVQSAMP